MSIKSVLIFNRPNRGLYLFTSSVPSCKKDNQTIAFQYQRGMNPKGEQSPLLFLSLDYDDEELFNYGVPSSAFSHVPPMGAQNSFMSLLNLPLACSSNDQQKSTSTLTTNIDFVHYYDLSASTSPITQQLNFYDSSKEAQQVPSSTMNVPSSNSSSPILCPIEPPTCVSYSPSCFSSLPYSHPPPPLQMETPIIQPSTNAIELKQPPSEPSSNLREDWVWHQQQRNTPIKKNKKAQKLTTPYNAQFVEHRNSYKKKDRPYDGFMTILGPAKKNRKNSRSKN